MQHLEHRPRQGLPRVRDRHKTHTSGHVEPEEDHVLGALDEGCNSTCHSKAWGELAEDRLRRHGLSFSWIASSAKSFAGLGSSTNTLGKRNLPF